MCTRYTWKIGIYSNYLSGCIFMKKAVDVLVTILGAALVAVGFNLMLIPHQLLSGGLSGISMILGYITGLNIGMVYLVLNLPVLVWGLVVLGKKFITYSVISVGLTVWFMQVIPVSPISTDPIISAVFGGVIIAIGTGISLRAGGSTGGLDIVGSILTRDRDFPLGMSLFALNGFVILALGVYQNNWNAALTSMLSMYIGGKIVDSIHIRHVKVTLFIVTDHKEVLLEKMLKLPRGVTVIQTEGAFTKNERDMLMTVTTGYELPELRKIIKETDPKAFVNIVQTVGIMGHFQRLKT